MDSLKSIQHHCSQLYFTCLQILSEPFYTDRKGEIPEGKNGYYAMPIVHNHNGLITINYGGEFIQARHQDTRPSAGTAFCCKHISSMLSHAA